MRKSQFARALPLVILLGGFALRLYRLGAESLWYDETVSLLLARSDLAELTRHTAGDIHPPLYYYFLHFWGQLAGWSEFSSAFLSLFFGVLLIALVFRIARDWAAPSTDSSPGEQKNTGVALVASLLVAVSPYNVWYSQEVRMYTIGAALGLLSVYSLRRMLLAPKPGFRDLILYVVTTALGIYTLYYLFFLLVFEYLYFAFRLARRTSHFAPHFLRFAASQIAIALLYLPWLPIAFRQATDPPVPPWRSFTPLPNVLGESFSALVLGQSVEPLLVAPFLVLVLGLIALLVLRPGRLERSAADLSASPHPVSRFGRYVSRLSLDPTSTLGFFLLSYTSVPLLAIYALSLWKPLYHVRYVFTYSPAFYILLALAICAAAGQLAHRHIRRYMLLTTGAVILYAMASAYSLSNAWFDPRYADDDLRGAVQYLAENWRPGDAIIVNAGYAYPALLYYYPFPLRQPLRLVDYRPAPDDAQTAPLVLLTGSIGGSPRLGWGDPLSDFYSTDAGTTSAALDRVFDSHQRTWVLRIYDTVTDPDGVIRKYLSDHGVLIDDQGFSGESNARVQGFLTGTTASLPSTASRLNAHLADRVNLLGFESGKMQGRAGEPFDAVLYWQPLETLNLNYQLSLQVLDSNGGVVAQHDEDPLGDALPTSRWQPGQIYREPVRLLLPNNLTPGSYGLVVKLYTLNSGEVLGDPIPLGTLDVGP